jgi:DNA-directed RNA polymerase subunit M/transcription elongation factor TFIIS
MIFLEEKPFDYQRCPECDTGWTSSHKENTVLFCGKCERKYRLRVSIKTTYYVAKDCELNGEPHRFEQIPDDFSPTIKEICIKCEAQYVK